MKYSSTTGCDGFLWRCSRQKIEAIITSPHLHPLSEGEDERGEPGELKVEFSLSEREKATYD
jgi:hypothetical protein